MKYKLQKNSWIEAQVREMNCWFNVKEKILDPQYQRAKKKYWDNILEKIMPYIKNKSSFLDIGCGPAGIFLASYFINNKHLIKVGVDSLMDKYLKSFPFLSSLGARFINKPFEDYSPSEIFDVIFIFNALDHMKNPILTIQKAYKLLSPDGVLIISLNVYNSSLVKNLVAKFRFLDPLHPYQFTLPEIMDLCKKCNFTCIDYVSIDDLRINLEKETRSIVFPQQKKTLHFWEIREVGGSILRKIFFGILKFIGYPVLKTTNNQKSVLNEYLFIFSKI